MNRQDEKWVFTFIAWCLIAFLFILPEELYAIYFIIVGCLVVYWFFKDILW